MVCLDGHLLIVLFEAGVEAVQLVRGGGHCFGGRVGWVVVSDGLDALPHALDVGDTLEVSF